MTAPDLATLRRLAEAARDAWQEIDAAKRRDAACGGTEFDRAVYRHESVIAEHEETWTADVCASMAARLERAEAALREIKALVDNSGRGNPIVDARIVERVEDEIVTYVAEASAP